MVKHYSLRTDIRTIKTIRIDLNEWKVVTPYWDTQNKTRGRKTMSSLPPSAVSGHLTTWSQHTWGWAQHYTGPRVSEWVSITGCEQSVSSAHASTPHRRGRSLRLSQSGKLCGWVILVLFIFTLRWFSLVAKSRHQFDEIQNVNNIKICLTK